MRVKTEGLFVSTRHSCEYVYRKFRKGGEAEERVFLSSTVGDIFPPESGEVFFAMRRLVG